MCILLGGPMIIFLIVVGVIILTAVIALGIIGYRKSKKLYAEFMERTIAKLPWARAEVLELNIEKLNAGTKYTITFADEGVRTRHTAYEEGLKKIEDLRNNEKPYIKFKRLKNDVPFPRVRGWIVAQGIYNIELHVKKPHQEQA